MRILKKEIEVCDVCNNNFSVGKCSLCERDVCKSCGFNIKFYVHDAVRMGIAFITVDENKYHKENEPMICKNCKDEIQERVKNGSFYDNAFAEYFIELMKKMEKYLIVKKI